VTVLVHLKHFFLTAVMFELSSVNNDKNGNTAVDISVNLYVSQVHLPVFLLCLRLQGRYKQFLPADVILNFE